MHLHRFALLVTIFLLLTACAPAEESSLLETPLPTATAAANPSFTDGGQSDEVENQSNPSESDSGNVAQSDDYGVSFQIDPGLVSGIQSQLVDAFADESAMGQMFAPQRLSFTFLHNYADDEPLLMRQQLNLDTMPQIVVYPAEAYAAMQPLARTQLQLLQALLVARPSIPGGTMPYLPLHNAAQVFHSQVAYLAFANGAGVRYLTAFAQDTSPVTNQQLIYTFQGLTDDGQHYVSAFFPVITSMLPDKIDVADWASFIQNYSTYIADTKETLNQLGQGDFTPRLETLDAMVSTLSVKPTVELAGPAAAEPSGDQVSIGPTGVYQVYDGASNLYHLYRVELSGRPQSVAEKPFSMLPAPDAAHAAYMDDDRRLWLIDLADRTERQLAAGTRLSYSYQWGDNHTLLVAIPPAAADEDGGDVGHLAAIDVLNDEQLLVDEDHIALGRPAMASDGHAIAYDIALSASDVTSGRIYQPGSGSSPFDPAQFTGLEGEPPWKLFNPSWSPDGRQLAWLWSEEAATHLVVFDLARQTAIDVHSWQPAQFGALPPSPVWSTDGKWLAIEVWANNQAETGLWVLPSDGTLARLHVLTGHQPVWLNATQLFYADLDENMNGDIKLFDLDLGRVGVLDLPAGSTLLLASY